LLLLQIPTAGAPPGLGLGPRNQVMGGGAPVMGMPQLPPRGPGPQPPMGGPPQGMPAQMPQMPGQPQPGKLHSSSPHT